jgi:hypothetical protein
MKIQRLMIATAILAAPLVATRPATASPGIGHTFFMRGSVVDMTGGHIVICIGRVDGAATGQVLKVYRNVSAPGPRGVGFRREEIGTVRIDAVLNEHYASASSLAGGVKVNDIVELERPVR